MVSTTNSKLKEPTQEDFRKSLMDSEKPSEILRINLKKRDSDATEKKVNCKEKSIDSWHLTVTSHLKLPLSQMNLLDAWLTRRDLRMNSIDVETQLPVNQVKIHSIFGLTVRQDAHLLIQLGMKD